MSKKFLRTILNFLFIVICGLVSSIVFHHSYVGKELELKGYDLLFEVRGPLEQPHDIVIVAIDEASFGVLGLRWPWPRSIHAELIRNLKEAGARLIAFDIVFPEESDGEDDRVFAEMIERAGNVILASTQEVISDVAYTQEIWVEPIQVLSKKALGVGLAKLPRDDDGFIRRGTLRIKGRESLSCKVASLIKGDMKGNEEEILINFVGPPRTGIKTVSYYQALDYKNSLPKDTFKDKIVLVGLSLSESPDPTTSIPDSFPTPFFLSSGLTMAGVEIHANFINTLLRDSTVEGVGIVGKYVIFIMLAIIAATITYKLKPLTGMVVNLIGLAIYLTIVLWIFKSAHIWLPAATPIAGLLTVLITGNGVKYFVEEREKRMIRRVFQQYMHPTLVEEVTKNPEALNLGGEEYAGTILFTDLAGFTSISEKMTPHELVSFFNEYFTLMLEEIFEHRGVLDKLIGDAIMAFWGIPIRTTTHAFDACLAALSMQQRMEPFNKQWMEKGFPNLFMRIGINTGVMVAGNMGSRQLFNYTVMGDTVNLGSRLEGANKIYGTSIMISEPTYEEVKDRMETRELDLLAVKGKEKPIAVYELIGLKGDNVVNNLKLKEMLQHYRDGLRFYKDMHWDRAIDQFKKSLELFPAEGPSKLYIDRCQAFQLNPPPPDWDRVFRSTTK